MSPVYAQGASSSVLNLPAPRVMVSTSPSFTPAMIKGVNVYPDNPLKLDFIIDRGDADFTADEFKQESTKLIKYFLAALTVPEKEMWVNLSPYEKDRIIPESFGRTEMGRDLLAQDYMLKQLSSSLMHPDGDLGKNFWDRVYTEAHDQFGTTEVAMNTFNKILIVPQEAFVYEHTKGAFVVRSHLKVMLEEDYLALESNRNNEKHGLGKIKKNDIEVISGVSSRVVREVLIPEIEKEVNQGKTFANLRQVYHSVILALWYKQALKESLLGQIYVDQNKTDGVNIENDEVNQKIYDRYVQAFSRGVYDFIKEDYDPAAKKMIPRKYFAGGQTMEGIDAKNKGRAGKGNLGKDPAVLANQPLELRREVRAAAEDIIKTVDVVTVAVEESGDNAMLSSEETALKIAATLDSSKWRDAAKEVTVVFDAIKANLPAGQKTTSRIKEILDNGLGNFNERSVYNAVELSFGERLSGVLNDAKETIDIAVAIESMGETARTLRTLRTEAGDPLAELEEDNWNTRHLYPGKLLSLQRGDVYSLITIVEGAGLEADSIKVLVERSGLSGIGALPIVISLTELRNLAAEDKAGKFFMYIPEDVAKAGAVRKPVRTSLPDANIALKIAEETISGIWHEEKKETAYVIRRIMERLPGGEENLSRLAEILNGGLQVFDESLSRALQDDFGERWEKVLEGTSNVVGIAVELEQMKTVAEQLKAEGQLSGIEEAGRNTYHLYPSLGRLFKLGAADVFLIEEAAGKAGLDNDSVRVFYHKKFEGLYRPAQAVSLSELKKLNAKGEVEDIYFYSPDNAMMADAIKVADNIFEGVIGTQEFPDPEGLNGIRRGFEKNDGIWTSRNFDQTGSGGPLYVGHSLSDQDRMRRARGKFEPIIEEINEVFASEGKKVQVFWAEPEKSHVTVQMIQEDVTLTDPEKRNDFVKLTEGEVGVAQQFLEEIAANHNPAKLASFGYMIGADGGLIEMFYDTTGDFLDLRKAISGKAQDKFGKKVIGRPGSIIHMTAGRILDVPYSRNKRKAAQQRARVSEIVNKSAQFLREEWDKPSAGNVVDVDTFTLFNDQQWNGRTTRLAEYKLGSDYRGDVARKSGGIDLNPMINNMRIQRDGNGVALPVFDQPIQNININGFVPVIINITPLQNNLLLMLGFSDETEEQPITDQPKKEVYYPEAAWYERLDEFEVI